MKQRLLSWVMVMAFACPMMAQTRQVTGKVTAKEDGSPMIGVSVSIKGTGRGVVTNAEGFYQISLPAGAELSFRFVGFRSQTIKVGMQSQLDVVLEEDDSQLAEVVVTGTGTAVDKRSTAFDVHALSSKKLPNVPNNALDQALVGLIPGALITSANGMPGQPLNVVLRGINTINRGTSPMVLLDGVELDKNSVVYNSISYDYLNNLGGASIDRIEVIQGAAASTIYGAQGANGVIQLFTKKGSVGKVNIDFTSSIVQGKPLNVGGLRKADKHGFVTNASNEVIGGSGKPLVLDPELGSYAENVIFNSTDPSVLINKPYDKNLLYYDHFKEFFVPVTSKVNSVSISSGWEKGDYMFSLSNSDNPGQFKNIGGLNRSNMTANLGFQLAKGLKFRSITNGVYIHNTINDATGRSIIYSVFNSRPFANYEFKDQDGNYPAYFGDAVGVNGANPNYVNSYSSTETKQTFLMQSFHLNYEVNRFLSLDAKYGFNYQNGSTLLNYANQSNNKNSNDQQYWVSFYNGTDNTGEIARFDVENKFQNFLGSAFIHTDFERDFGLNFPIKTITHLAFDYRKKDNLGYITYGIGLPTYTPVNIAQAKETHVVVDVKEPFVTYGYLINQRFDLGTWGGFSGGIRTDYSSAFGSGSKPFTFPRGDAYLRLSEFNFIKNSGIKRWLDEVKFRVAYGKAGIQPKPFDRYVTLNTGVIGGGNAFYFPLTQSNPNLQVEISQEREAGLDIGLNFGNQSPWFNGLDLSASYWKRSTDNAIFNVDAAPSTGVGTVKDNAFGLASHGLQASIQADIFKNNHWNWDFTMNVSKGSSEITSVRGSEVVVTSDAGSTGYVLRAGEKIGQLFGYLAIHSVDAILPDGTPAIPEDKRSNYVVASNGWVVNKTTKAPFFSSKKYSFGDPNPDFSVSFINNLTFKDFLRLSWQVDWVQGAHAYNQTKEWMYRDGIHSDYAVPLTINGETGAWSAFYRGVYAEVSRNGTKNYFYEDASFVRLRQVSLGLDVSKLMHLNWARKLELVLSGRNLLTLTKYTGLDPEISSGSNNSAWDRGIDHNTMPNNRSYQIQLNLGF